MEVFLNCDVTQILRNKFVVIIGDSIQRGIYKDLVLLLQSDRYLTQKELRSKGEFSFLNDELIEGGQKGTMSNGISYKEVREYVTNVHLVRFYFVTRCYNSYVETLLKDLAKDKLGQPDIIILNSCLWDISRYGPDSFMDYKENLVKLFELFSDYFSKQCLIIWNTALPISSKARGGFLVPEIEFMSSSLRMDILEANFFAGKLATQHGFDVLDLHFYLRHHLDRQVKDGVHWDHLAHRHISNLLLSHICEAWMITMPANRPAYFGSYGSVNCRNGFYQQFPTTTPTFTDCTYDNNFNTGFNVSVPIVNNGDWLNHQYYQWQPYEQNSTAGATYAESTSRRKPYHRNRR
ncbi:PC-esterase domain-containing protein 1B-like [Physella acuta]|uniref:PC-esterase domain-containing protein 1B-like n=1 Tax=Physella acuta TaxID=109671 RepID=UPI0027DE4BFD|nr:PC-esterase domain-containing protein 1B-like [Physella acuta]XP_059173129.1 PC-esterase domain-containing protein 1B-like [Physella acuta]